MSDMLNRKEVEALLAAVEQGEVEIEVAEPGSGQTVVLYDFKRPERVNKDQIRALTALHEGFARNLSAALSSTLRTVVELSVVSVEQLTYSEFIVTLPNPSAVAVLSAAPLQGKMVLEIHPDILYPILDRMLGGSEQTVPVPERPLTDIERRLFHKLISQSLPLLGEMWTHVRAITFEIREIETNPQLIQIASPHEPVVVVAFRIAVAGNAGTMNLCIPFTVIEPVMGQFSTQNWFAATRGEPDRTDSAVITRSLAGTTVQTVAELAHTTITLKELVDLRPGDVVKTDQPADAEITLYVEGKPKFYGRPGRVRRNKAVEITRPVPPPKV